jgi:hypothetical protein
MPNAPKKEKEKKYWPNEKKIVFIKERKTCMYV